MQNSNFVFMVSLLHIKHVYFSKNPTDQVVQWLGEPTAAPKVRGSKLRENHGCHNCLTLSPPVAALKNWQTRGASFILRRACRPTHSKFSVVFSDTCAYTGQDPFERSPRTALRPQAQVSRETIRLKNQQPTNLQNSLYLPFITKSIFRKFFEKKNPLCIGIVLIFVEKKSFP